MRPRHILFAAIALVLAGALAACATAETGAPDDTRSPDEPGSPATDCAPDFPGCDDVVVDDVFTGSNDQHLANIATNDLVERLNAGADDASVQAADVDILHVFQHDWSDACLGVHYPDQACAQVITPGYVVILSAAGVEYRYHTDSVDQVIATDFAEGATIEQVEPPKEPSDEEVTEAAY